MSALQDPPRMAEAEDVPAGLKNILEDSHKDVLSQAQVLAIASAVSRATAGASLAPVALKGGGGSALKWLGGVVIVGLLGGAAYLGLQGGAPEEPAGAPAVVTTQAAPKVSAVPAETPATASAPAETAKPRVVAPSAPAKASAPNPKAQLLEESRLLSAARAALSTDPKKALALTEQHRAKFPRGTLTQEREVIAIQALAKLGKQSDADRRADRFGKDYPDSAHKDRVQGSVEGEP